MRRQKSFLNFAYNVGHCRSNGIGGNADDKNYKCSRIIHLLNRITSAIIVVMLLLGAVFKIMDNQPVQEKVMISTKSLSDLAIYLSGVKDGKGNLLPLGTVVLDDLWAAVKYLQGDVRYTAERDVKGR